MGITLDALARRRCAEIAGRLQHAGFEARYEAPEKYHITLAFLGNVASSQLEAVQRALEPLSEISALKMTLDRVGGFPHERRPRVVFIGSRDQGRAFIRLATETLERYAALGFQLDKDPVAHVTIARVKAPQLPIPLIDIEPIPVAIAAVSLFESLPDRANNTSRYEIVKSATLAS